MNKKEEILSAALKLFVEFGFHGTATSKIAKEAGVANGTLFHYYATKDDLIISLYISLKVEMAVFAESFAGKHDDPKMQFKNQFINALNWAISHPEKFQYIQQFYNSPFAASLESEELQRLIEKNCVKFDTLLMQGY